LIYFSISLEPLKLGTRPEGVGSAHRKASAKNPQDHTNSFKDDSKIKHIVCFLLLPDIHPAL
jgi:hypothetical protein